MFWAGLRMRTAFGEKAREGAPHWSDRPAREQESLKRVSVLHENGTRFVERAGPQVARHRMLRHPNLEHETVAAAGKGRRQHSDDRFYQSTLMQGKS